MPKKIFIVSFLSAFFLGMFLFLPPTMAADEYGLELVSSRSGLQKFGDIPTATGRFLGGALSFVGVLFFILTIYGGVTWMTSHGNNEQAMKGLKIIVSAIVGLIIVLSAYAITRFVFGTVEGGTTSGGAPGATAGAPGASCTADTDCGPQTACVAGRCQTFCTITFGDTNPNYRC